jgi:hypothetical protein
MNILQILAPKMLIFLCTTEKIKPTDCCKKFLSHTVMCDVSHRLFGNTIRRASDSQLSNQLFAQREIYKVFACLTEVYLLVLTNEIGLSIL